MNVRSVVVLALLCSPVGDCVPHRLPSRLVGEVAQVRRIVDGKYAKRLPLVLAWRLEAAGEVVGWRARDLLGGEWYKRAGDRKWRQSDVRPAWVDGVEREIETEVEGNEPNRHPSHAYPSAAYPAADCVG